ncbi:bifunctional 2-methylcitrate synthase/citrate synthase [Pararhodospirillum photometricum]|uniref:Citrate synthase n=1 Tax=Pararhodospirillum photometricum DSM 122 TaxID=1150469 RepID=H6SKW7_PARPM|nr:bifunctional 2-methylcitrate synthase/citrate synthase [Pararhodospirillum photometricum]CCG08632.1 2-methylcitrate synthase [Pararhodospirillum photometricum DSM 122]
MTAHLPEIRKGLAGVVVDTTAISKVMEETNSLTYRGYPVQDLAASCSFEEVAFLIWHGELPNADELRRFMERERARRSLSRSQIALLSRLPDTCHPMDTLRTAVSLLGAEDPEAENPDPTLAHTKALDLLAKLPTVVALDLRRRRGEDPIPPNPRLGFAANFFHMCFGVVPEPEVLRCFEISLILYAEHSFNASTFTARVVTSTLSDMYSAVTAAIGALKGSLHGGANEAVMHMMLEVGDPGRADGWLRQALAEKRKIMGFGHRVYKHGDSRVPTMKQAFLAMAERRHGQKWVEISEALERAMLEEKGIHPNLDFPTGPAYYLMGFDIPLFTPIFVMSRITGWTAHIIEQAEANALIRPLSAYSGAAQRAVPAPALRLAG